MVVGPIDDVADTQSVGGFFYWGGLDQPIPHGPIGAQLEALETGPGAISYLTAIDVRALDADERVAYLRAWERQGAWLTGMTQSALLAVAGPEPEPDVVDGLRSYARDDWARDDIAAALGVSTRAAGSRVHTARLLGRCLPSTQSLLESGAITWRHVQALVDECAGLPDPTVSKIEARVIERAPRQTAANFRRSVRRAVLALADAKGVLAEAVTKTQRGVWLTPEADGMATLSAFLPVVEAHAAYELITRAAKLVPARAKRVAGGTADAATASGATSTTGTTGATGATGTTGTTGATGATGATGGPSEPAMPGLDECRADAFLAMVGVDLGVARNATVKGRRSRRWRPGVRVELQVVIDAPTLAGLADNPAELRGYGPIAADTARDLFAGIVDDAKLRRLVTDPVTGHLLDYGRRTYRIPKPLADYVRARDKHCRFPGCLRPATADDVDHVVPWSAGGRTSARNSGCLCRRHHRLKTHGGWQYERRDDGSFRWTSPDGTHYDVEPARQLDTG